MAACATESARAGVSGTERYVLGGEVVEAFSQTRAGQGEVCMGWMGASTCCCAVGCCASASSAADGEDGEGECVWGCGVGGGGGWE